MSDDFPKHHNTKGGSRETEVNELTVIPKGCCVLASTEVSTATPVAKHSAKRPRIEKDDD